jgi:hypothetical protein
MKNEVFDHIMELHMDWIAEPATEDEKAIAAYFSLEKFGSDFMAYYAGYLAGRKEAEELIDGPTAPRWETPEQYQARTGNAWPDNAAVRALNPDSGWELMEYWRAKQLEQDLARLDKDFGDDPEGLLVVCDSWGAEPPPDDWRPEESQ